MPRSPRRQSHISEAPLTFRGFWQTISAELGPATIVVDDKAKTIQSFLTGAGYHREMLRDVVHRSFSTNACDCLDDLIDVNKILDVLGEVAFTLVGNDADDLLDIELLEEIAFLISTYYPHHISLPKRQYALEKASGRPRIIDLDRSRVRRANKRL